MTSRTPPPNPAGRSQGRDGTTPIRQPGQQDHGQQDPPVRSDPPVLPVLPVLPGLDVTAELGPTTDGARYQARRYATDYAVTVFNLDRRDRADTERRMNREAALLTAMAHPRLPTVHEVGTLDGRPYLVTDLVSGRPLADLIAGDPLSVPQAMRLVLDVVEPLSQMHRQGLLHRDLSSRALIVQEDGSARLRDAGTGARPGRPTSPVALGYLAPEQTRALARPVDNRTDLYALGVVLFECLTGTLPFLAADLAALAELQATQEAPDPRALAADLPESLALLVTTLLAREPGDRYQSGEELAADLRLLLGESLPTDDADPDRLPELFGRERELELINELWEQVRRGRGRGIAVRGVTGVGKTRLIQEAVRDARRNGTPVLALACRPDETEPLAPLRRAVEQLLRDADLMPALPRNVLLAQVQTAAGSGAPLLARLTPALADLLGAGPLPDGDRQDQLAAALARFIAELARLSGGLLLVMDDADLIDPGTLRVMSHLAPHLPDVPVLGIGGFRTDRQARSRLDPLLPAIRAATDLDLVLERLERPGLDQLVLSRLPGIDPESAPAAILRDHSAGNPFVLLTQLRLIIEAGLIRPHRGSWVLDDPAREQLQLPGDPAGLVNHTITSLPPATRRALEVAAVVGERSRPLDLAEIGDLDPAEVYTALAGASGDRLVELTDGGEYRFRQERIRNVLLAELRADDVAQLHQSTAEVLGQRLAGVTAAEITTAEVYEIAQHYLLGIPSSSTDRAFEICQAAGRRALQAHAPDRAVTFLEHAARLRPGDAQLLLALGTALHRDGRYPEARERLEESLVVEQDGLHRAQILLRLTEVHRATRNIPKSIATIEWGLAELNAPLPGSRLFRALGAFWAGLTAVLITLIGWGFGTASSRNRERQDLLAALHLLGGHLSGASLRPAGVIMHRLYGIRAAVRLGTGSQYALSLAALGLTAARYGFARLCRRTLASAEQAASDLGDPQLVAQIAWSTGAADYLGRVDNGERWIRCLTDHGPWLTSDEYSDIIAAVCWDAAIQGRDDDVLRWAENGRARRAFGGEELTSLLTVPAIGLTAAGRPAAANAELRRVRESLEQHGDRGLRLDLVLAELYALLEQDHVSEHFDAVAERFFDLKLSRTGMLRQHQSFFVLYAQGRLAQCRAPRHLKAQDPESTPAVSSEAQLALARSAVKQLGAVARTPLLRAAFGQSRAELLTLEGKPKQALALLARLEPQREDAPLLGFEIARTTARALLAAGYPAEARRQVLSALNLAKDHGWTGRRSRLAAEFGLRSRTADTNAPRSAASAVAVATATVAAAIAAVPAPRAASDPVPASAEGSTPASRPAATEPEPSGRIPNRELDLAAALRDTLVEMSATADPVEILRQLVTAVGRVLPRGQAWLIRPAPQTFGGGSGTLAEVLFSELPASGTLRELVFDPDLRTVASASQPVIGDPDSIAPPQLRRLLTGSASWLLFPLASDGVQVGVLVLASARTLAYADTEIAVAGALVAQGMAAYGKASLIARLQELSGTDKLTGIRSLRRILELASRDLQGARNGSRPLAVMLIGLDHLDRINALHGQATGDDVIRQVAVRLGQVIRDTDLIGRYREDEFIVVLSQGRDGEDGIGDGGVEVAERLLTVVSGSPVPTRIGPLPVTVTVGLTLMAADDTDIASLTARAEAALYSGKRAGRNQVAGQ